MSNIRRLIDDESASYGLKPVVGQLSNSRGRGRLRKRRGGLRPLLPIELWFQLGEADGTINIACRSGVSLSSVFILIAGIAVAPAALFWTWYADSGSAPFDARMLSRIFVSLALIWVGAFVFFIEPRSRGNDRLYLLDFLATAVHGDQLPDGSKP
jgi:hypothetical protein